MPWITVCGLAGKVYVPDDAKAQKKHPCPGCFSCQWCDENRCEVCRHQSAATVKHSRACRGKRTLRPACKTGCT